MAFFLPPNFHIQPADADPKTVQVVSPEPKCGPHQAVRLISLKVHHVIFSFTNQ
jgi:hypothetical protein